MWTESSSEELSSEEPRIIVDAGDDCDRFSPPSLSCVEFGGGGGGVAGGVLGPARAVSLRVRCSQRTRLGNSSQARVEPAWRALGHESTLVQ